MRRAFERTARLAAPLLVLPLTTLAPRSLAGWQATPTTIGVALSGGSAKGIAHVGVLRALERAGVRIDVVAGTSMGSVVGGLYAMGLSVDSIESIMASADWPSLVGDAVPRERRYLDQRRLDERAILAVPVEGWRVSLPSGAILGSNLLRVLEDVTWGAAMVRRFTDLPRPFVAVATDLETGEAVPLRRGALSQALRASSGIPGIVEPMALGGRLLVDGGLSRNLPATDAQELGADFVICSDVSDPLESAEELESLVDVLMQLASFSMVESTLRQREICDVLIQPDIEGMSSRAFDRVAEWVERGEVAGALRALELRELVSSLPETIPPQGTAPFLGDSVRIVRIEIEGTADPRVVGLVRDELELSPGDFVSREQMSSRLGDLDATGLFGLVRYRLDQATDGAALTVEVDQGPRDRLGVGLRYDDERKAALLFTATLHNLLSYGSVARFDLRVGEETQIGATLDRYRGVTGPLGVAAAVRWSQAPLDLPASEGGRVGVELSTASLSFGLAGRATHLGGEVMAERAISAGEVRSVRLLSASAVLDHESLDRIDRPRRGADVYGRFEWGGSNVLPGGRFSVAALEAGFYVPINARVTLDLGGFLGHAEGSDLPPHRRFFLGGAHRSTVFRTTHPLFQGLDSQEHSGLSVQVARLGLRWDFRPNGFLRAGMDVGGVRDVWRFPMKRPMTGWALAAGTGTLIGPILLELSQLGSGRDPRVSVAVGRGF